MEKQSKRHTEFIFDIIGADGWEGLELNVKVVENGKRYVLNFDV